MARIAGVDLPREKRAEIGLTYIYGIGRTSASKILAAANVNPDTRVRDLTDEEVGRIRDIIDEHYMVEGDLRRDTALNIKRLQEIGCYRGIRVRDLTDEEVGRIRDIIDEHYMVEGDLRRDTALNIKRLQEIGCYRGIRHRKGLPVRGQKTKTNARTRKGPKRTVANKKK